MNWLFVLVIGVWLIITEIIYIFFMRDEKDNGDWIILKISALGLGAIALGFLSIIGVIIYLIYEFASLKIILIIIGISVGVFLFFLINYFVSKKIVKGNKKRKKKS